MAVDALGAAPRGPLPPRIDHFFFVDEPVLRRAVDAGIHVVVQPRAARTTPATGSARPGCRARLAYQALRADARRRRRAGRQLRRAGGRPSTCSPRSTPPSAAACRAARPSRPSSASASTQALRMYTRGAAAALGMEGEIGQLRPGARADAVLLSEALDGRPGRAPRRGRRRGDVRRAHRRRAADAQRPPGGPLPRTAPARQTAGTMPLRLGSLDARPGATYRRAPVGRRSVARPPRPCASWPTSPSCASISAPTTRPPPRWLWRSGRARSACR